MIDGGGSVLGAATLTGKAYLAKLALSNSALTQLRVKYGAELEIW